MPVKVLMPALSPTMKSGTIAKWHKNAGDAVKPGDIIADIETDKAVIEFEYADEPGVMYKILKEEGSKNVAVNQSIAVIKVDGDEEAALLEMVHSAEGASGSVSNEAASTALQATPAKAAGDVVAPSPANKARETAHITSGSDRVKASPLAKKLAAQLSVDISKITGSGPYGRVVKADVLGASVPTSDTTIQEGSRVVEVSTMRKVISERLAESKRNIPHFYLAIDCMVGELLEVRSRINSNAEALGTKITVNDLVIKATALAVREFPEVNALWAGDKIVYHQNVDIAFAVALDDGLLTPVIAGADKMTLSELSKTAKSLVARAKDRKLLPHEFQGGCLTISNLGMFCIKEFYAIINPPQSCIMAVGQSEKRPVVVDNCVVAADVMSVTLSVDHRVIDGALAAKFLNRFKFYIENPLAMLA
ncbi:Dihydrolipoyllysine-residue acetyltransferase component of pyruvate dehydrogenase complex [Anaplasma phagocytophilum]|uniref:pyruvate dehydrogenase complex dihydrolipoamide acetyltransferase n=1 Tax=Anaplasma phagocytophilum TaxID=948 RepID=UPI0007DF220A|nr:pyruvate dehydrogenase complex dihydrolipoamide acetyltransferase [Anaplasma phagocytophilum]SCV62165.1 Dihydrolipoyllysine-residue acetyltransferase component of pyruvate dehydrogenase complex [Anaplasma phagocytophilum]